jgi:aminoglycoside phosphotransferase (APT) family kinase protein
MTEQAESREVDIDVVALECYLDERLNRNVGPLMAVRLEGGRSNLTYEIKSCDSHWVLRRPPLGLVAPSANDVSREFRFLRALHAQDVPTPAPVILCEDTEILGFAFSVVQFVSGWTVRSSAEAAALGERARQLTHTLVEGLAQLHRVDVAATELVSMKRSPDFLRRQVATWHRQWRLVHTRDVTALDRLHAALLHKTPLDSRTTVVHGDYRIDNVLFTDEACRSLAAIIDWEMATFGDPMSDLGLLLVYWDPACSPVLAGGHPILANVSFPEPAELVTWYEDAVGYAVGDLSFHVSLAYFKLAVIAEGIHRRYLDGHAVGDSFDGVGDAVEPLLERGLSWVDGASHRG